MSVPPEEIAIEARASLSQLYNAIPTTGSGSEAAGLRMAATAVGRALDRQHELAARLERARDRIAELESQLDREKERVHEQRERADDVAAELDRVRTVLQTPDIGGAIQLSSIRKILRVEPPR